MNSFGSNIFETLGCLHTLTELLKDTVIYNSVGSSSLILFFKIIGFTYLQSFEILKNFELTHTFINGYFLIPEDEEIKKEEIKEWLLEKMLIHNLFSENSTLEDVFKLTKIFPNFIVWSRKENKLIRLNPKETPNLRLIDCILSTLSFIGTFCEFNLEEDIISNYYSSISYPHNMKFILEEKNINTLYIGHKSRFFFQDMASKTDPFSSIETELINQTVEMNNLSIQNTDLENFLILYDDIYKNSFNDNKRNFCFDNGIKQGDNFKVGDCNDTYYKLRKIGIDNQT